MMELFTQNPGVVFYILGGFGTIAAMIIGVVLIRRRNQEKRNATGETGSKKKKK